VYRYQSGNFTLNDESGDECNIKNLKDFVDKQAVIIVLMANWSADPPGYDNQQPYGIDMKVIEPGGNINFYESDQAKTTSEHYGCNLDVVISSNAGSFFSIRSDSLASWSGVYATKMIDVDFSAPPVGQSIAFSIQIDASGLTSSYDGTPLIVDAPYVKDDKNGYANVNAGISSS
jgi:hypothetical protein